MFLINIKFGEFVYFENYSSFRAPPSPFYAMLFWKILSDESEYDESCRNIAPPELLA